MGWELFYPQGYWKVNNFEVEGSAVAKGGNEQPSYAIIGDKNWQNYSYKVRVLGVMGIDKEILFRINQNNEAYILNLRSKFSSGGNDLVLAKRLPLGTEGVKTLKFVQFVSYPNVWYDLQVDVVNTTAGVSIKALVNGSLILDYIDNEYDAIQNGSIGFEVWPGGYSWPILGFTTTRYDDVVVSTLEGIPSPSPTPTPTPTPLAVIIPGFGATWNTEAILSCDPNNNNGTWFLLPIAEPIYMPIMNALKNNNIDAELFLYDWRKDVRANIPNLSSFLEQNLAQNQSANLVGHSLGGLVGRAYLEQKGLNNRLNKFLTVGSPHRGAVGAYLPWEGGDIKINNFLMKMAIKILIKHCGHFVKSDSIVVQNISPSLRNILPIDKYLYDWKTGEYKEILSMVHQNNWLNNEFVPPSNVQFETLSGTGFQTLKSIEVKDATKHDESLSNWEDGRPTGKTINVDGDDTVLLESSQSPNAANNYTLNQTHGGLISSTEGINKIFQILGFPEIAITQSLEPKSALIIIGFPSTFEITDREGRIFKDKEGIVSFINPKQNNYKFNLVPASDNTLFIVGQFLENDNVLWKEYEFKGKETKKGIIKFDPDSPLEDSLEITK